MCMTRISNLLPAQSSLAWKGHAESHRAKAAFKSLDGLPGWDSFVLRPLTRTLGLWQKKKNSHTAHGDVVGLGWDKKKLLIQEEPFHTAARERKHCLSSRWMLFRVGWRPWSFVQRPRVIQHPSRHAAPWLSSSASSHPSSQAPTNCSIPSSHVPSQVLVDHLPPLDHLDALPSLTEPTPPTYISFAVLAKFKSCSLNTFLLVLYVGELVNILTMLMSAGFVANCVFIHVSSSLRSKYNLQHCFEQTESRINWDEMLLSLFSMTWYVFFFFMASAFDQKANII